MEMWMSEALKTCEPMTLPGTTAPISSPESASGTTPCASPDGPRDGQPGRRRARASRSQAPAAAKAPRMTATFGPGLWDSSPSDVLTWSLESRYRRLTASLGSTLYELTWKPRATPVGRWIPAQRASARHMLVSVSIGADCELTGWPTPQKRDYRSGMENRLTGDKAEGRSTDLNDWVLLAGWNTPRANDAEKRGNVAEDLRNGLVNDAVLSGWPTPRAEDAESAGMRHSRGVADTLTAQVALMGWATPNVPNGGRMSGNKEDIGKKRDGSKAQIGLENQASLAAIGPGPIGFLLGPNGWEITQACGQLRPDHSRWLMGIPEEWDKAAILAFRSLKGKKRARSG